MLELLKKPVLRIPLFLGLTIGLSIYAMYSCQEQVRTVKLMRKRHTSFIQLLARTVSEQKEMPDRLGPLVWRGAEREHSELEALFLREFAEREEFTRFVKRGTDPLEPLRGLQAFGTPDMRGKEHEILWSDYMFRVERRGGDSRDFAIFSWPLRDGRAQLTLAYLSTDPQNIYYTAAARYAGPGNGPTVADLGEAPFEGRIFILPPESAGESTESFHARATEKDGRIWAVQKLHLLAGSHK